MKISVINYSSRKNGNCHHIAEYVEAIISGEKHEYDLIDFSAFSVNTCGKCNYECFGNHCVYKDDEIYRAYRKILDADIVISVIPIYGGLPCSNFFAFSERVQGAFQDDEFDQFEAVKNKYIIVGNTGLEITKKIVGANDSLVRDEDFLAISSNEVGERSVRGNLMDYELYRGKIREWIKAEKYPET